MQEEKWKRRIWSNGIWQERDERKTASTLLILGLTAGHSELIEQMDA